VRSNLCSVVFHVADDGLPAVVHMDVLDADKLLASASKASKNLNLHCISSHQTSRRRSERRYSPLCCKGHVQLRQNRHDGSVRTGHLDGERSFNFVAGRCGFDHREGSIHGEFGNSTPRRTRCRLYLEQRSVHEVTRRGAESFIQTLPPQFRLAVRRMYSCQLAVGPIDFHTDGWRAALNSYSSPQSEMPLGCFRAALGPDLADAPTLARSPLYSGMPSFSAISRAASLWSSLRA
jgi:hypothetical protein